MTTTATFPVPTWLTYGDRVMYRYHTKGRCVKGTVQQAICLKWDDHKPLGIHLVTVKLDDGTVLNRRHISSFIKLEKDQCCC